VEIWNAIKDWFLSLGEKYGVNPYIFSSIYVGAIPFFFLSLNWLIKNLRHKRPILGFILPMKTAGLLPI